MTDMLNTDRYLEMEPDDGEGSNIDLGDIGGLSTGGSGSGGGSNSGGGDTDND